MMHMRALFGLLVGLALLPTEGNAQEFQVQEKASLAAVPLAELKPKTIVFADQPGANKDEVFVSYEDWTKAKPLQQQLLSLYPGYSEPNLDIVVDGIAKPVSIGGVPIEKIGYSDHTAALLRKLMADRH